MIYIFSCSINYEQSVHTSCTVGGGGVSVHYGMYKRRQKTWALGEKIVNKKNI